MKHFKLVHKKNGHTADVRSSIEDKFPDKLFEFFNEETMSEEEYDKFKEELYQMLYELEIKLKEHGIN